MLALVVVVTQHYTHPVESWRPSPLEGWRGPEVVRTTDRRPPPPPSRRSDWTPPQPPQPQPQQQQPPEGDEITKLTGIVVAAPTSPLRHRCATRTWRREREHTRPRARRPARRRVELQSATVYRGRRAVPSVHRAPEQQCASSCHRVRCPVCACASASACECVCRVCAYECADACVPTFV